ncbi:hypothetical protein N2W54_000290 [Lotmaria passim]
MPSRLPRSNLHRQRDRRCGCSVLRCLLFLLVVWALVVGYLLFMFAGTERTTKRLIRRDQRVWRDIIKAQALKVRQSKTTAHDLGLTPAEYGLRPDSDATATTPPFVYALELKDGRTAAPVAPLSDAENQREEGEHVPEQPERLPGLMTRRQTHTPEELLRLYGDTDVIYIFADRNETTYCYRVSQLADCGALILKLEAVTYATGGVLHPVLQRWSQKKRLPCLPRSLVDTRQGETKVGSVIQHIERDAAAQQSNHKAMDTLRHSIRSLEQHVRWHRGRVVIVSPGHHPTWVDGAKNFLAGACGDASVQALRLRGTHLRLTTVHQDAVMPYGLRFTADSHVIEQHIWRVRNITPVHVYMNDDYFVNRDVAITDLFNEYGGTIVRTEGGVVGDGVEGPINASRQDDDVRHTQWFATFELDIKREDDLPWDVQVRWMMQRHRDRVATFKPLSTPTLTTVVDAAYQDAVTRPSSAVKPRRRRHFSTHAPFVYCTNMFRFFATRYEREFAYNALHHRFPAARDLHMPFLYNAFVMARPWQASPQFLPYLLQLHRRRRLGAEPNLTLSESIIRLNNIDGCAPASLRGGWQASETLPLAYDTRKGLQAAFAHISEADPLFFRLRSEQNKDVREADLLVRLASKYPSALFLEETGLRDSHESALKLTFDALMALPVLGVVSYEEGACPLVRSLSLAFAGHHRGRVHVAVQRHGLGEAGEADESLRETRRRLGHRVISALPATDCSYSPRVSLGTSVRDESLAELAARVIGRLDAGVELPSTCGHSGDNDAAAAGAGLRVRGFVIDARTPSAPVKSVGALRDALAMPGQTLALEDFRAVRVGPEDRDVVLVLAREDADAKAVHWITGASENDLLVTYPLPVEAYENMTAFVKWSAP